MKIKLAAFQVGNYMFRVNNRKTRASASIINFEEVNAGWVFVLSLSP